MLKIRLQRVGRKHEPSFRVLLTDSKNSTKSGRFKEILGSYDPRKTVDLLKTDRIKYWLGQGAIPSDTVHNLFVNHKIIDGKKVNVLPRKTPPVKETPAEEAPVDASPAPVTADGGTPQDVVATEDKAPEAPTDTVVESTEAKA